MEGGCYAKTIDLDAEREPQIYQAIRFGAMLENIGFEQDGVTPNYADASVTQNTRVSYPITHIPGASLRELQPTKDIFFLTCDAFRCCLPSAGWMQARRCTILVRLHRQSSGNRGWGHRASGDLLYMFSAVHAASTEYAEMLGEKMEAHSVQFGW